MYCHPAYKLGAMQLEPNFWAWDVIIDIGRQLTNHSRSAGDGIAILRKYR